MVSRTLQIGENFIIGKNNRIYGKVSSGDRLFALENRGTSSILLLLEPIMLTIFLEKHMVN